MIPLPPILGLDYGNRTGKELSLDDLVVSSYLPTKVLLLTSYTTLFASRLAIKTPIGVVLDSGNTIHRASSPCNKVNS